MEQGDHVDNNLAIALLKYAFVQLIDVRICLARGGLLSRPRVATKAPPKGEVGALPI